MKKLLTFLIGIIVGLGVAVGAYTSASAQYSKVTDSLKNGDLIRAQNYANSASALWPPYIFDPQFQSIQKSLDSELKKAKESADITVYFEKDANIDDIEALLNQLELESGVDVINHVTPEKALELFKTIEPDTREDITAETFPHSAEIFLSNTDKIDSIMNILNTKEFIEKTDINPYK